MRQNNSISTVGRVLTLSMTAAVAGFAGLAAAQAPAAPDRPWPIPERPARDAAAHTTETDITKQYDLAELIDLAESTNPETREAWDQAREAAAAIGLVKSAYMPQLSLQAIGGLEHTPLPAPKDLVPQGYFVSNAREFIPSIGVKWLLFDFGRRTALLSAARADSFVANVAFTAAHEKLIFTVTKAYFDLGAARGRLRAAHNAVSTAASIEAAAVAKQTNGLATVVSVAQARRQSAQARYQWAAAEGAERVGLANLVTAMGLQAGTPLSVLDSSQFAMPPGPENSVAAAVEQALVHQPQIIAALGRVDASEAMLESERRSYYPTIELAGRGFQNMGSVSSDGKPYSSVDKPGGDIMLSLSVPIFDGGMRASRISVAAAKMHEAEDKLAQARDATAQQVVKAYNALTTSLAEGEAAQALSVAAHTAYDAALRAYQQGLGTYTDLATEENAVVEADTQVEDALANAHTAAAALAFAIGSSFAPQGDSP